MAEDKIIAQTPCTSLVCDGRRHYAQSRYFIGRHDVGPCICPPDRSSWPVEPQPKR